jgi:hypothetical protein
VSENVNSTTTRSTETNAEEMGDIQKVRRGRIYEEMTDEDEEEEEGIILSKYVLISKMLSLLIFL